MRRLYLGVILVLIFSLGGCDMFGDDSYEYLFEEHNRTISSLDSYSRRITLTSNGVELRKITEKVESNGSYLLESEYIGFAEDTINLVRSNDGIIFYELEDGSYVKFDADDVYQNGIDVGDFLTYSEVEQSEKDDIRTTTYTRSTDFDLEIDFRIPALQASIGNREFSVLVTEEKYYYSDRSSGEYYISNMIVTLNEVVIQDINNPGSYLHYDECQIEIEYFDLDETENITLPNNFVEDDSFYLNGFIFSENLIPLEEIYYGRDDFDPGFRFELNDYKYDYLGDKDYFSFNVVIDQDVNFSIYPGSIINCYTLEGELIFSMGTETTVGPDGYTHFLDIGFYIIEMEYDESFNIGDSLRAGVDTPIEDIPEIIGLLGSSVVESSQYGEYTDEGYLLNPDIGNLEVTMTSNVDISVVGDYTVTYTVTYQDVEYTVSRVVRVFYNSDYVITPTESNLDITMIMKRLYIVSDEAYLEFDTSVEGILPSITVTLYNEGDEFLQSSGISDGVWGITYRNLDSETNYKVKVYGEYELDGKRYSELLYELEFSTVSEYQYDIQHAMCDPSAFQVFCPVHLNDYESLSPDPNDVYRFVIYKDGVILEEKTVQFNDGFSEEFYTDFYNLDYLTNYEVKIFYDHDVDGNVVTDVIAHLYFRTTIPYYAHGIFEDIVLTDDSIAAKAWVQYNYGLIQDGFNYLEYTVYKDGEYVTGASLPDGNYDILIEGLEPNTTYYIEFVEYFIEEGRQQSYVVNSYELTTAEAYDFGIKFIDIDSTDFIVFGAYEIINRNSYVVNSITLSIYDSSDFSLTPLASTVFSALSDEFEFTELASMSEYYLVIDVVYMIDGVEFTQQKSYATGTHIDIPKPNVNMILDDKTATSITVFVDADYPNTDIGTIDFILMNGLIQVTSQSFTYNEENMHWEVTFDNLDPNTTYNVIYIVALELEVQYLSYQEVKTIFFTSDIPFEITTDSVG